MVLGEGVDEATLYDVIVVGMGAMGCASAYHLSKHGLKVLGIERQDEIGHSFGSSHGDTRITRKAYFEHPQYVKMVCRAYELFAELEKTVGQKLFYKTGGLDIGPPDSPMVLGAVQACKQHDIPYEVLTSDQLHERFPGMKLPAGYVAVYQADAGVLRPERCNRAHYQAAFALGARCVFGEKVTSVISELQDGEEVFRVSTPSHTFSARKVVISAGAWMRDEALQWPVVARGPETLRKALSLLEVERQVVAWHVPQDASLYHHSRFPIYLVHHRVDPESNSALPPPDNSQLLEDNTAKIVPTYTEIVSQPGKDYFYYGFPMMDEDKGVKMARYNHLFEISSPDHLKRTVDHEDLRTNHDLLENFFTSIKLPEYLHPQLPPIGVAHSAACMFTNTPDGHFVIDAFNTRKNKLTGGGIVSASAAVTREVNGEVMTGASGEDTCDNNIVVMSACSGHGFKFAASIGEAVAHLLTGKRRKDIEWLNSMRFKDMPERKV